jgi:hypothetical protein
MAQRDRTDSTIPLAARLSEEARFIWRHRERYRPGLTFVPPAPPPVDPATAAWRDSTLPFLGLDRAGLPGAISIADVLLLLSRERGTARELPLVEAVLWRSAEAPMPKALREACADVLAERGYLGRALAALAGGGAVSPPAEAAPPGPAPGLNDADPGLVAAALARDIEAPGMKERHHRARTLDRAARLSVEMFRSLGGQDKRDALHRVARELEALGEMTRAGEAYALAGDQVAKALVGVPPRETRETRETREAVGAKARPILAVIGALDRRGRRLEALARATTWLAKREDDEVAAAARGIFARLLRGPAVDLTSDGAVHHYLLGAEITIGRVGATIALPSPAVSRLHARLRREGGRPVIEDLGSHNGTAIGGAKIIGPLPIGAGLVVDLAGEIHCLIRPLGDDVDGPLLVEIAGTRYVVPLGEARIGALRFGLEAEGDESIVALRVDAGAWAAIEGTVIATPIELCEGDVIRHGEARSASFQVICG